MDIHKTDKDDWEHFWDETTIPSQVNPFFSNDKAILDVLNCYIPAGKNERSVLEVGCAPGKWLIYIAKELEYIPEGCEYLDSGVNITQKNLQMCGVQDFKIHNGDFLIYDFKDKKYDLVISLGFIEHFNNPIEIINKMVDLLNNDGMLVIGIPKFTGINYYLAKMIDPTLDFKILPTHNLSIMNKDFFLSIRNFFKLKLMFVDNIGGFEPALFDISRMPLWFKFIFYGIIILLNNSLMRWLNREWYSGYILAIYQKKIV